MTHQTPNPHRVRAVQERRRSNAATPHDTQPTRAQQIADALTDWDDDTTPDTPDAA